MNQQKTTVIRSFRGGPQAQDQLHHAVVMQMQASGRIFQERADNSLRHGACERHITSSVRTIDAYRRTLLIQPSANYLTTICCAACRSSSLRPTRSMRWNRRYTTLARQQPMT